MRGSEGGRAASWVERASGHIPRGKVRYLSEGEVWQVSGELIGRLTASGKETCPTKRLRGTLVCTDQIDWILGDMEEI